jgi:hypothetical protein
MVQFCASIFHVASSAFYRLDGEQRVGAATCCLLCSGFLPVNATYRCLIWELIDRIPVDQVALTVRKIMRFRSITTLCLFGVASVVALKYPLAGLAICICCLIAYLKPGPPIAGKPISPECRASTSLRPRHFQCGGTACARPGGIRKRGRVLKI